MIPASKWDELSRFIDNKSCFLITTHINPDGDGLGSQIAMAEYLKQLGKKVVMVNNDPMPAYFDFMDPDKEVRHYDKDDQSLYKKVDGAIIVDISDWERLGKLGNILKEKKLPIACIDHHIQTDEIGDIQVIDQTVSSTGELVYNYLKKQNAQFNNKIVTSLYTSILTDTGSFRFSNTTADTHHIAADLLDKGADFQKIFRAVYENHSKNRMHLTGILQTQMQFDCNDKLVWYVLTKEMISAHNLKKWELEGFSELPRFLRDTEVSLMFTENENGVKVSFRSKGNIPINGLANTFGGGGHQFASGAFLKMGLTQALDSVLPGARKLFNNK